MAFRLNCFCIRLIADIATHFSPSLTLRLSPRGQCLITNLDNIRNFAAKDDSQEMQFVLMMYGGSVLITELQEDHPEQDLGNLSKSASEVETSFLIFQVE